MSLCPYFDILEAIGNEVATVAGVNQVSVRTRPLQLDGVDPTPHVIVWPGPGGEKWDELRFGSPGAGAGVAWLYPVTTVIITAGNRIVEMGLGNYLLMRQGVRNIIFRPTLGAVASVSDCNIDPKDVFDLQAFLKGNYDITGFVSHHRSNENLTP